MLRRDPLSFGSALSCRRGFAVIFDSFAIYCALMVACAWMVVYEASDTVHYGGLIDE